MRIENSRIDRLTDSLNIESKRKARLLNIDVLSIKKQVLISQLENGVLFTPNVDHMVRLQKDRLFFDAYQQADWVICDSIILYRLTKLLSPSIAESIPGATLFRDFCDFHQNDEECSIFILGGKQGVPQKAMENINRRLGRLMVVGAHSPSFSFVQDEQESARLVQLVKDSGATVLVVCATSPKQEIWIAKYRHMLPKVKLFMALGATVDFEAGTQKRCPVFLQQVGLEWFWRFCHEPRRLFHRYFIQDMQFFWYFGKQLLGVYKNPFAGKQPILTYCKKK